MSTIEDTKEEIYKVHEIPLNVILTNKVMELDTPLLYILNTPITIKARLNNTGSDLFTLNRLSLIKASIGKKITRLYITTTETSTDTLDVMASDKEILGDIGVKSTVSLTTALGIEYDARLRKSTQVTLMSTAITTIQDYYSSAQDISNYDKGSFALINNSDVDVTVQFEASNDGSNWLEIGSSQLITASGGKGVESLTDSWYYIRIKVTNTVLGTSGNFVCYGNYK